MDMHSSDTFGSISPAEFFYRNRQMAGFGNPSQALYSTVRELVENSLDACEDANVVPDIRVKIDRVDVGRYRVTVSDNGAGIPPENVPEAFGRVLYGSKYGLRQRRGTFGLGVTMAVLYAQMTTNTPVEVHTQQGSSGGRFFKIFINIETNRPVVELMEPRDRPSSGTTVSLEIKSDLKRSKDRVTEYIRLSSIGTPHARLELKIENEPIFTIGPWTSNIPLPPKTVLPHPRAADVEFLKQLIRRAGDIRLKEFLIRSFQQVGERNAGRILQFVNLSPSKHIQQLTRDETLKLSHALQSFDGFTRPDGACLSPIGKDAFLTAIDRLFTPRVLSYTLRGPSEWSGSPFIVEGALAIVESDTGSDVPDIIRFANRVPLLYDASDGIMVKINKQVSWSRYKLATLGHPLLFVHLCSTRIPYRAAGKQSIASIPELESEILSLYRDLGRQIGRQSRKYHHASRERRKMREFERMFRLVAKFGAELAGCDPPPVHQMVEDLFEVESDE